MTTTTMPIEHARALALLCEGRTARDAGAETDLALGRIVQLARRQGWTIHPTTHLATDPLEEDGKPVLPDDIAAIAAAPPADVKAPRPTTPEDDAEQPANTVDQLLADARACDDRHVKAALHRADTALDKLRDIYQEAAARIAAEQRAEQERQAALAEIAELEHKLAEARERAKQAGAKPHRRTTSPTTDAASGATEKSIRAWALEHGIECNTRGRIPQTVRDQYLAAHPEVNT